MVSGREIVAVFLNRSCDIIPLVSVVKQKGGGLRTVASSYFLDIAPGKVEGLFDLGKPLVVELFSEEIGIGSIISSW